MPSSDQTRPTAADHFDDVAKGKWRGTRILAWPPDVFGLVAYALQQSGLYRRVLDAWPQNLPEFSASGQSWGEWAQAQGSSWRQQLTSTVDAMPPAVKSIWCRIRDASDVTLGRISGVRIARRQDRLVRDLLSMLVLADVASVGFGLPVSGADESNLQSVVNIQADTTTLATILDSQRVRVLPKLRTPQTGVTLRSLSHNLALHIGSDVSPCWYHLPQSIPERLNVLVAPWPLEFSPAEFQAVAEKGHYGLMAYQGRERPTRVAAYTRRLLRLAERHLEAVQMLVFPESSLTEREFQAVAEVASTERELTLVAGVRSHDGTQSTNTVRFFTSFGDTKQTHFSQDKHHRWKLDGPQITRYGLEGILDPSKPWWEDCGVPRRQLHFVSLNAGTTMCCLICEDLARSDPVASLVRSVGPNLMIALLLDGPQVKGRWADKYASVYAEDPGTSVLAVSSLGMVHSSKPRSGERRSRQIARWVDVDQARTIKLPKDFDGAVLSLRIVDRNEWTIDERSDGGVTSHPLLERAFALSTTLNRLQRLNRT